ncbi:MAG: hypothetical protein JO057_23735 [Chloroflexi bacterium]|nr:hypothetical protein [Chloroflexota bacterium]
MKYSSATVRLAIRAYTMVMRIPLALWKSCPTHVLVERMNWTSALTWPQFLAEWAHSSADRDYVPAGGESSR